ncbi:replication/maintenance protein RepL [Streptomyces sp. NPDC047315]|uniref:replication/maintenance protein RepL n=1 Tax=Streptomyces sp. NPDC047315 TaxID=3155142 RepID=UPI0033C4849E
MLKLLDNVASHGGTILAEPPKRKYQFHSGQHTSLDLGLQGNLWRFGLTGMARNLLDHMSAEHDLDGQLRATQKELAEHFGCSQPKVSKALGELFSHHFAWKVRRGVLQVNPTYAYRWGSKKHHSLMTKLGAKALREHTIVIPDQGRQS